MSYENWITSHEAKNITSMAKAQAAHDNQEPPSDEPCQHKWKITTAKDGTEFAKCTKCGLEIEL